MTEHPDTEHPDGEHPDGERRSNAAGTSARMAPRQVTLRRAPRYRSFVLTGLVVGVAIALLLTRIFPETGEFSARAVFGYLAVGLGLLGGVLGGLVAVLIERPRR